MVPGNSNTSKMAPKNTFLDYGHPSDNPYEDLLRSLDLANDERCLVAYDLFVDAKERVRDGKTAATQQSETSETSRNWLSKKTSKSEGQEKILDILEQAENLLKEREDEFENLRAKAATFKSAEENLTKNTSWIYSHTLLGISTYYRHEADNSLSVKIEGEVTGVPIFEQLAVIREGNLFHYWAPFCTKSSTIKRLGWTENISWFECTFPIVFLTRDCLYRGIACDNMHESRNFMIVSKGINDEIEGKKHENQSKRIERSFEINEPMKLDSEYFSRIPPNTDLPPKPEGKGGARIELRCFQSLVEIVSEDTVRTRIIVNLDPNLAFIPKWMIEFCMKKIAGVLLLKIQYTAKYASNKPYKSPHAKRIIHDSEFYRDWLVPRFEYYYRKFGWTVQNIPAFAVPLEDSVVHINHSDGGVSASDASVSVISSDSRRSTSSLSSKKSFVSWVREREMRKKRKKDVAIALSRSKAVHMLKPKGISEDKKTRVEELLSVVRGASDESNHKAMDGHDKDHPRSLNNKIAKSINTQSASKSVPELSIAYSLISLLVMMIIIFGKLPTGWHISSNESKIVIFLRTLFLLTFYGLMQIQVIWSSLIVVFDALEQSATSSPILKSAKIFYSSKMRSTLFLFTFGIIFASFGKAFIIVIGRHIEPSFEFTKLLNGSNETNIEIESSFLTVKNSFNFKAGSHQNNQFSVDFLSTLFTVMKEIMLFFGKVPLWFLLYCTNFTYNALGDANPELSWEDMSIDMASSWMAYSTTYFVILSIMFSTFLVPQKSSGISKLTTPQTLTSTINNLSELVELTDLTPIPENNDVEETSMSESHSPRNQQSNLSPKTKQQKKNKFIKQIEKGKARFKIKKNKKKSNVLMDVEIPTIYVDENEESQMSQLTYANK